MSGRLDLLQKQKIQHESITGHGTWIGKKMQENFNEKSDESEWNGRKKKKKLLAILWVKLKNNLNCEKMGHNFV